MDFELFKLAIYSKFSLKLIYFYGVLIYNASKIWWSIIIKIFAKNFILKKNEIIQAQDRVACVKIWGPLFSIDSSSGKLIAYYYGCCQNPKGPIFCKLSATTETVKGNVFFLHKVVFPLRFLDHLASKGFFS